MSKLTIVTFLKSWRGYAQGETAGFDATKASDLTESGVAELFKKGSKAASASKPRTVSGGKSTTSAPLDKDEEDQEQDEQEDSEAKDTNDDTEAKP